MGLLSGRNLVIFVLVLLLGLFALGASRSSVSIKKLSQTTFKPQENVSVIVANAKSADITTELIYAASGQAVEANIKKTDESRGVIVEVSPTPSFKSGKYKFLVTARGKTVEQDFTWGVLAVNTNKAIYLPGDTAYLQLASLNDLGHTICDATLKLEIEDPAGKTTDFGTKNGDIKHSSTCGSDNVTDNPDYYSYYKVGEAGTYRMKLTNITNGYSITDTFDVKSSLPFIAERTAATRINPFKSGYTMYIKVTANQDFSGEIDETVPNNFQIISDSQIKNGTRSSSIQPGAKTIYWEANLKRGESVKLDYTYQSPKISPEWFFLGPLAIGEFKETRRWQIASDAISTMTTTADTLKLGMSFEKKGIKSSDGSVAFFINKFTESPTGNEIYMSTNPDAASPTWSVIAHNTNFSISYPNSITMNTSTNNAYTAIGSNETNQRLTFMKETYNTGTHLWAVGTEVLIGNFSAAESNAFPDIEVDSTGHLWIAWKYYKSSGGAPSTQGDWVEISDAVDPGTSGTWASPAHLSSKSTFTSAADVMYPTLRPFTCGAAKLAAIYAHQDGTIKWRYRNDADATGTWAGAEATIVSSNPADQFSAISDSSGNLHLVYQAGTGIKYRKGTCSGGTITWDGSDTTLSASASDIDPTFSTDGSNLYVLAGIFSSAGKYDIAYKKYTSSSTSWGSSWTNITTDNPVLDNEEPGTVPNIGSGNLYFTWNQGTASPYNVQYASVVPPPTKVAFSNAARSLYSNICNGIGQAFTMQLQNDSNTASSPLSSTVVRVTSNASSYTVYSDSTCSTPVANGDFTFTTSDTSQTVYLIDNTGTSSTNTLSGTRQSGDSLATGTQNYAVDPLKVQIRGGTQIRGGAKIQ